MELNETILEVLGGLGAIKQLFNKLIFKYGISI